MSCWYHVMMIFCFGDIVLWYSVMMILCSDDGMLWWYFALTILCQTILCSDDIMFWWYYVMMVLLSDNISYDESLLWRYCVRWYCVMMISCYDDIMLCWYYVMMMTMLMIGSEWLFDWLRSKSNSIKIDGWMHGWMDGWVDRWIEQHGRAIFSTFENTVVVGTRRHACTGFITSVGSQQHRTKTKNGASVQFPPNVRSSHTIRWCEFELSIRPKWRKGTMKNESNVSGSFPKYVWKYPTTDAVKLRTTVNILAE